MSAEMPNEVKLKHEPAVRVGGMRTGKASVPKKTQKNAEAEDDVPSNSSGAIEVASHITDLVQDAANDVRQLHLQQRIQQRQHQQQIPSVHKQYGGKRTDMRPKRLEQPRRSARLNNSTMKTPSDPYE